MRATRPRSTRVIDMAYVIFGGDMFVTAFMVGLAIWLLTARTTRDRSRRAHPARG